MFYTYIFIYEMVKINTTIFVHIITEVTKFYDLVLILSQILKSILFYCT